MVFYVAVCKRDNFVVHIPTAKTLFDEIKRERELIAESRLSGIPIQHLIGYKVGLILANHLREFKDKMEQHLEESHNVKGVNFPSRVPLNDFREFFVISTFTDQEGIMGALNMDSNPNFWDNWMNQRKRAKEVAAKLP